MIHLTRIDQEANIHRDYSLGVQRTLFGEWELQRHWGRIGAPNGRFMATLYKTKDLAEDALTALMKQKLRKGYTIQAG